MPITGKPIGISMNALHKSTGISTIGTNIHVGKKVIPTRVHTSSRPRTPKSPNKECAKCVFNNNPPDQVNCLYCTEKLEVIEIKNLEKDIRKFLKLCGVEGITISASDKHCEVNINSRTTFDILKVKQIIEKYRIVKSVFMRITSTSSYDSYRVTFYYETE